MQAYRRGLIPQLGEKSRGPCTVRQQAKRTQRLLGSAR